MKRIYYRYILLLLAGIVGQVVYAQRPSLPLERQITLSALRTIDNYESFNTVADDEVYYSFLDLFVGDSARVYNDLFGLLPESTKDVEAKKYADMLKHSSKTLQTSIANQNKGDVWKEGNVWKIRMSFDKTISHTNSCGIYYGSQEFYGKAYRLTATLVYDDDRKTCKIERIDGQLDAARRLPADYYVFMRNDSARDSRLKYNGKALDFNSRNQMIIPAPLDPSMFAYDDPDTKLRLSLNEDCKKVTMAYKQSPFRLIAHYDIGLGSAYSLSDEYNLTTSSSSSSFGIDVGYSFPSRNRFRTALFLGVGMSTGKIDASFAKGQYEFHSSDDVDGDTYTRYYNDLALSQTFKVNSINIPLYVDLSYRLSRYLSTYLDLGAQMCLNVGQKVQNVKGQAYVYGLYDKYDGLRLDEQWGYNGFGMQDFSKAVVDNDKQLKTFNVDLLGKFGFRVNIPRTPLAVDFGVNYQLGVMDMLSKADYPVDLYSPYYRWEALVYNTINRSNLSSQEHVRNFAGALSQFKNQSLKIHVGLMMKF